MAQPARALDLENTLYLDLKDGRVVIEMLPDLAPVHVARIKELARAGFYDGVVFPPRHCRFHGSNGRSNWDRQRRFWAEAQSGIQFGATLRGTVSMARSLRPDSADSQFFIVFERAAHLDRQYTVWGRVTDGMQFVDGINKVSQAGDGIIDDPDKILRLQVAADAA